MKLAIKSWVPALAFLMVIAARPVDAGSKYWKGPGWYMVYIGAVGIILMGGPYDNENACQQVLLPPDNGGEYRCDYLKYDVEEIDAPF